MNEYQKYRSTKLAANIGYVVQAIVVNFAPLLFVTFQRDFGVSLSQLSLLVTLTFLIQLVSDLLTPRLIDRIGQRAGIITANFLAATGLILLPFLSTAFGFGGIVAAAATYALGASFIEVLVSPIVEACPSKNKPATMSLLHSFYSWGSVLVILGSTVLFWVFGVENWRWISLCWALVPIVDGILFFRVPMATMPCEQDGTRVSLGKLLKNPTMLLFLLLMTASGAAELAVAQWASAFAEAGLGVSKAVGDLLGPLSLGALMGVGRLFYAFNHKLNLERFMLLSAILCAVSYLLIVLSPWPAVSLLGCGLVGFGVAVLWPGALSMAAVRIPEGGTTLFAIMACFGDIGCCIGPTTVGLVSDAFGGDLKLGILAAMIYPLLAILSVAILRTRKR